ncbi:MAG TPA: DUF3617 family protein [Tepidiformaceae bacterium]|nr:DUF3617 family protein [Tepidiformaceae bacterium]
MSGKILALACLGSAVGTAVSASMHPLDVKTGEWQIAETVTWSGVPPQMRDAMPSGHTHTYQTCVKSKDLNTNPWAEGSSDTCTWTVLSSTGTDMEVQGSGCDLGKDFGMTANVHGKIHVLDPQNGTGSFDIALSGNGQTVTGHATYTGKWIASSCSQE